MRPDRHAQRVLPLDALAEPLEGVFCGDPHANGVDGDPYAVLVSFFDIARQALLVLGGGAIFRDALAEALRTHGAYQSVFRVFGGDRIEVARPIDQALRYQIGAQTLPDLDRLARDQAAAAPTLRSDLKGGLEFLHTLGMQTRFDLVEMTAGVQSLTEELVASGLINLRRLEQRKRVIRKREIERFEEQVYVRTESTPDKYAITETPDIPCAELIPLCKARCCILQFPLSLQDVTEGVVEWELGAPYMNKKGEDGYCVHCDGAAGGCDVYTNRPSICRTYSCKDDKRVWLDYDKRIPAPMDDLLRARTKPVVADPVEGRERDS